IRALRGKVRGGITVVIESPHEVDGLRTLLRLAARLPGEPLANAYQAIDSAGPGLASWPEWRQSGAQNATESEHAKSKEPESEIDAALGFASSLWNAQSEDKEQLALAMTLPKPGRRRAYLETRQPALLLDHGSVRARLTAMGAQLRQFGVALFPKAPSRRQGSL